MRVSAHELVRELALGKARWVSERRPDNIVIGADTLGVFEHVIIGKPKNSAAALEMLRMLSGKTHLVLSSFAIILEDHVVSEVVETQVQMRKLTEYEIQGYVATGESLDKMGSYGIQGLGALLIERVVGDYYSVVGMPLNRLAFRLREFGIELLANEN